MKRSIFILLILSVLGATAPISAQPPPPEGAPPSDVFMPPDAGGPPPPGEPPFHPASPLQRWMQELQENDPAEFERLQDLRMSDPKQFRTEARARIQQHGMEKLRRERPAVYDALMAMPEEDRTWLTDRLINPMMGRPAGPMYERPGREHEGRPEGGRGPERGVGPDIDHRLIRQYREATSEEEKTRLREELRKQLSDAYDQQLDFRRAQLADAEEKLTAIRTALEQGETGKDAFIDKKLSTLLDRPLRKHRPQE